MDNLKRDLGSPTTLVWPWWKAEEAGRGKPDPTKTSPRNVPVLPLEIVENILREACEWPLGCSERELLTACASVCKSWLPVSRRLLYHSLIVETGRTNTPHSPGTKPGIIGLEALLQQSHLLTLTRSLSVTVMGRSIATVQLFSEDSHPEGCRESVQIPDFIFLLAHTPRLRLLNLSIYWTQQKMSPLEPHALDWLSSLVLPVEALDLNDYRMFDSTLFYDLVGVWPTIQALRMHTSNNGPPPEMPSIGISLRELRLPTGCLATNTINLFLPPPPRNEQSRLCFLELWAISEEALLGLSVHAPSVSTLTLAYQPVEFAHLFTKLEELVIAGPFIARPLTFPRTLKHIRIRVREFFPDTVLHAVAQVIPTLPDLRVISIEPELTSQRHYPDLQKACEAHKVEILVNSVNSSGRAVHPYHAEMDRFPRRFTFSEFFDIGDRNP